MSSRYFQNKDCEYYPCHGMEELNCLFCFCPLYPMSDCGGTYTMIEGEGGKEIKDCSHCCLPHLPQGYDYIINRLRDENFSQKG